MSISHLSFPGFLNFASKLRFSVNREVLFLKFWHTLFFLTLQGLGHGIASENACYLIAFLPEYLIFQHIGGINDCYSCKLLTFTLSYLFWLSKALQILVLKLWFSEPFRFQRNFQRIHKIKAIFNTIKTLFIFFIILALILIY